MQQLQHYFATCARGVEDLLTAECEQLGLAQVRGVIGGVHFEAQLEQAYRLCLWSRLASRVLLELARVPVATVDELYDAVHAIDWSLHLERDGSFAIDCNTSHPQINNSHYATLKIKDAIADRFRETTDRRPDVSRERPDIRINCYIDRSECSLYLDLSGEPLHRRGYRLDAGVAPLKESLAAAILLRAQWPQKAAAGQPLLDPMCGAATLLIEAAFIAGDIAPGLLRDYYGFMGWKQHQPDLWQALIEQARERAQDGRRNIPVLVGIDKSYKVVQIALGNIEAAGLKDVISIIQGDVINDATGLLPRLPPGPGLIVTNPPYGKRLGVTQELKTLYMELGVVMKRNFAGWDIALFTAEHELAKFFGLRAHHKNTLYNGPLKCTLYHYHVLEARAALPVQGASEHATMFANRLVKNYKHLKKWANREGIGCYRVYDADIPEYAVAIDIYEDQVHVQEYEAPKTVNVVKAFVRLNEVTSLVADVLERRADSVVIKTRKKQRGSEQYQRVDNGGRQRVVRESGFKFSINLTDYLDTGLFLDHRNTRRLIYRLSRERSFLNLFAYTGAASVYAAAGGARITTTVDMSNTYLDWARHNLDMNGFTGEAHRFIRADCLQWLLQAGTQGQKYELIFLDPPTFSNSKKMERTLDIRRDHVELIEAALVLLDETGLLLFSCNAKAFRLDAEALGDYALSDITGLTTTEDFRRKPAHRCWLISRAAGAQPQPVAADFMPLRQA
jgi:23S rRNA (guanine2069-N7)-methyltransferase / 23S rRNA (guanine2445-N2)-methyltransferase